MEASTGSGLLTWIHRKTPARMNTYTAYSIGDFAAWAVLWAILAATEKKVTLGYIFAIFSDGALGGSPPRSAEPSIRPPRRCT